MSAAVKETVNKSKISGLPGFSFNQDVAQEGRCPLPPVFMSCEDIEQSLLAETAGSDLLLGLQASPSTGSSAVDVTSVSHHLLPLRQKQTSRSKTLSNGVEGMTPFFSQPGGEYHLKAGADEQEHQPWYGVPAPAVNSMRPDSKEVEASTKGQLEDGSLSQTQLEELILSKQECSCISASGQGLWGDGNAHNEQMLMDSMSGIISSPDGSVLNEVNGDNNRVDKWDLKRVADGEGNKEELLASNQVGRADRCPRVTSSLSLPEVKKP
ncbi:unnamed protein product [Sphagnum tenellum]